MDINDGKAFTKKYRKNPNLWAKEILGVHLWSKQQEILHSVFNNRKTVVRASFGVGKTYTAAVAVLAFIYTEAPSIVVTTASNLKQVRNILWREINYLFKTKLAPKGWPGKILQLELNIPGHDKWFAIGLSPEDEIDIQGYHQLNMLIIADECPGVRKEIIDGLDGLMANENAHMLWIGNPLESSGHFYDAFSDSSFTKFIMTAFDSPNFTGEDVPNSIKANLVSKEWVEDKRISWGEDHPLWKSRVMAEFPKSHLMQIIGLTLCEEAKNRKVQFSGDEEKFLGLDVARFGIDKTVFTICQGLELQEIIAMTEQSTMETVGQAVEIFEEFNINQIRVDEIGMGAGVVDRLDELGLPVVGINTLKVDGMLNRNKYANLGSELWFNMANWMVNGKIPDNDFLIADLVARRFRYNSDGTRRIEKKEDLISRLGRSPDYGDSAVMSTPVIITTESIQQPPPIVTSQSISTDDLLSKLGMG